MPAEPPRRWRVPTAAVIAVVLAVAVVTLVDRSGGRSVADPAPAPSGPPSPLVATPAHAVAVRLGTTGRAIPAGFLGLSIEFDALPAYAGTDPNAVDPVFTALVRGLTPGQAPVVRIGGNSTDVSYVPAAGLAPPPYRSYVLSENWLQTAAAFAHETGARMTMGIDLAADSTRLAAVEAGAFERALGPSLVALEVGNEPNLYGVLKLMETGAGVRVRARLRGYAYPAYLRDFERTAAALPHTDPALPLEGPALVAGPTAGRGSWVTTLPNYLRRNPRVSTVTIHRYPLRSCYVGPKTKQYGTIPNLLSEYSTAALASGVLPWIRIAHAHGRTLRIDELNSVACRGREGVSDTFASALWATDALFSLAHAGVDGVNLHTLPSTAYELFQFSRADGRWRAWVRPVYYGAALFGQAAPAGSRLVPVQGVGHSTTLSAWATRAPDGTVRMVLIDKDPGHRMTVTVPRPAGVAGAVTVERMNAPSVSATGGVTLGGRSFGRETYSGTLGAPASTAVGHTRAGRYVITVPGASAALVTFAAR